MRIGGRRRTTGTVALVVLMSALMVGLIPTAAAAGGLDDPGGPGMTGGSEPTESTPSGESTLLVTTSATRHLPWPLLLLFLAALRTGWRR